MKQRGTKLKREGFKERRTFRDSKERVTFNDSDKRGRIWNLNQSGMFRDSKQCGTFCMLCFRERSDRSVTLHVAGVSSHLLRAAGLVLIPALLQRPQQVNSPATPSPAQC